MIGFVSDEFPFASSRLLEQANIAEGNRGIDPLAHVVNGHCCDARRGDRFHLYPRFSRRLNRNLPFQNRFSDPK